MKKTLYTLNLENYAPEITALTYPLLERYADKIQAKFEIINDRKFPGWPLVYEKLQIYERGKDNDWNYFIDSDALVHPDFFDPTEHIPRDTVLHNGADMANNRWTYDRFFRRDGRHIGSCTWFCVASEWCRELWKPLDDLTLEEAVKNIHPTVIETNTVKSPASLIDDYTMSRNIAKYGLKFQTTLGLMAQMKDQSDYLWHQYVIVKDEKVRQMKHKLVQWELRKPPTVTTGRALQIEGFMSPDELNWLAEQATEHKAIVEIGSYLGRSTRALADNTPGFVLAIDDWQGPRDVNVPREQIFERFQKNVGDMNGKVRKQRMDYSQLPELKLDFTPDMIFVDGDHEYESVKRDLQWAVANIAPGGLLCGHDLERPEVRRAIIETLPDYQLLSGIGLLWWAAPKR